MFNTSILDVAIGMVFIYLLLSLLCTATNELMELLLKKRAIDLERGIRELLVQPESASDTSAKNKPVSTSDIVKEIYNHPLVNSLYGGTYEDSGIKSRALPFRRTQLPSYIPARNFALALMDTVMPGGAQGATSPPSNAPAGADQLSPLRTQLQNIGNPRLQKALTPLIDAAAGDVARVRANIEEWYNSSMDRVSGWYKRRSHIIILVLGFLVAVAVNADSVLIVRRLASDRALRDSLVASANVYAQEAAKNPEAVATPGGPPAPVSDKCADVCNEDTPQCRLKKTQCEIGALGLPLGWSSRTDDRLRWNGYGMFFFTHVPDHLFGWLLTALAISLGAPFWFDVLNKIIVIRSTVKPKEKSQEDKSKD